MHQGSQCVPITFASKAWAGNVFLFPAVSCKLIKEGNLLYYDHAASHAAGRNTTGRGLTLKALIFFMKTLNTKGFFSLSNHHNGLS